MQKKQLTLYKSTKKDILIFKAHLFGAESKVRLEAIFKAILANIKPISSADINSLNTYLNALSINDSRSYNTSAVLSQDTITDLEESIAELTTLFQSTIGRNIQAPAAIAAIVHWASLVSGAIKNDDTKLMPYEQFSHLSTSEQLYMVYEQLHQLNNK